jgi:hypothetical protein
MFVVFCLAAIIGVVWVLLTMSGWLSFRWSRTEPDGRRVLRLAMAIVPFLLGLWLCLFQLRLTVNSFSLNLSWFFVVPTALGAAAIVRWFRPPGRNVSA